VLATTFRFVLRIELLRVHSHDLQSVPLHRQSLRLESCEASLGDSTRVHLDFYVPWPTLIDKLKVSAP
jgi:hypothetical protein